MERRRLRGSRRSHRKSRNGCANCKRRRIKCDETKPACGQCMNHAIRCDFTLPQHAQLSQTSTHSIETSGLADLVQAGHSNPPSGNGFLFISSSQTDFKPPKRRYQRRQPHANDTSNVVSARLEVPLTLNNSQSGLNVIDLEIFHHYLSQTSIELMDPDDDGHTLQVAIPQLGFRFHYILHLLLALSSYHMARRQSMGAPHERILAGDRHYNVALTQVSSSIAGLDQSTCHAIYGSSVLICLCSLAKGPRAGEYLAFSGSGHVEWLTLLRGIRSITEVSRDVFSIDPVSHSNISAHEILPEAEEQIPQETLCCEWAGHLEQCKGLVEAEYPVTCGPYHAIYLHVLSCLTNAFGHVYGRTNVGRGERCAKVFQWLYQLPEEFMIDLQQRKWLALLLLSYFLVLLQELDSYWFIQGWPAHVMGEIHRSFSEEQRVWMQWQADRVRWRPSIA
ncbi:hypothetical protein BDV26DRAFT_54858 [Aspergillus bertholletiae]|uniref:Zn(2)-C6 fungal-type domain-containing protein n=1 Tax=Aspergillus bertholletiae TaxID=1226010 RepID=A0A5N7AVI9_9EURO|nr:hypothetical protein BDV26DRAFT_54858 [Aspergillus bertholletiae]